MPEAGGGHLQPGSIDRNERFRFTLVETVRGGFTPWIGEESLPEFGIDVKLRKKRFEFGAHGDATASGIVRIFSLARPFARAARARSSWASRSSIKG